MKTPKRKLKDFYSCPQCGAWILCTDDEANTAVRMACPQCGAKVFVVREQEVHAELARWKRKNREARLRHKMDLLNSQLFLCSWFIERHMGLARKFAEFVKEMPVECRQGDRLISTTYFTVTRRDVEGS